MEKRKPEKILVNITTLTFLLLSKLLQKHSAVSRNDDFINILATLRLEIVLKCFYIYIYFFRILMSVDDFFNASLQFSSYIYLYTIFFFCPSQFYDIRRCDVSRTRCTYIMEIKPFDRSSIHILFITLLFMNTFYKITISIESLAMT